MRHIGKLRRSKKVRLILMGVLILIAAILSYFFEKVRCLMIGVIVALLVVLGFEMKDTDYDLGKLMETGSLKESRVQLR